MGKEEIRHLAAASLSVAIPGVAQGVGSPLYPAPGHCSTAGVGCRVKVISDPGADQAASWQSRVSSLARSPARTKLAAVPVSPRDDDTQDAPAGDSPAAAAPPTARDRLLLAVFWTWAGVLALATVSHLAGWDGVLDALSVKRWFAR